MATILDQYGLPISSGRFLDAANDRGLDRPGQYILTENINRSVNWYDHRVILSVSRRLWANMGLIKGATCQKAMYAVERAWNPVFLGAAKDWGDEATRWLMEQYYPLCDVRGPNFDFKTNLYLSSISVDRDGDVFKMFTETADGWPQTQYLPAHRVGTPFGGEKIVQSGQYTGLRISHGIIYNALSRPVAVRVLREDVVSEDYTTDNGAFDDVSMRDIHHSYDPEWFDQGRGFPAATHALNDLRDMKQSSDWERHFQLIASALGLEEHNETGGIDPSDPRFLGMQSVNGVDGQVLERVLPNGTRYFKSNTGAKVSTMTNDRPGDMWEKFQDRMTRSTLVGMNWPYALCWKNEGTGPVQRTEIDKARGAVEDRQDLLEAGAKREVGYAISKAIKLGADNGGLPPYPGADRGGFLKWSFTKPPKISIDDGRDAQQRRENFKMGLINMTNILAEGGKTLDQHLYERAYEVARRKEIQAEVSAKTGQDVTDNDMMILFPNQTTTEDDPEEELPATPTAPTGEKKP